MKQIFMLADEQETSVNGQRVGEWCYQEQRRFLVLSFQTILKITLNSNV